MVGVVAGAVLQFGMVVVVTHGLHPAAAGAFLEAMSVFLILSNIGDLGADDGLVRALARLRATGSLHDARRFIATALIPVALVGCIVAVAVFIFAPEIARIFFSPRQRGAGALYLRVFCFALPLASLVDVALSGTRGLGSMKPYVGVYNVGVPGLRVVAVGATILAGASVYGVGLGWALPLVGGAAAAVGILLRMAQRQSAGAVAEPRPTRDIFRELWTFSAPRALATAFGVTITYLDVLLVGAFVSTRQAAIYAAISRLSVVGNYALQGIRNAIAPQVSELIARQEMVRLEGLYRVSTWWAMAMCFPVYIGFAVFAPIVTRLFGHAYGHGSTALIILCLAGLVNAGTGGVTLVLLMAGNSRLNLLNTAASLALNLGLNLFLIPRYGIEGAAIAWAASILLSNLAALVEVRWITGIRPFGRGYWIVSVTTGVSFGAVGIAVREIVGTTVFGFAVAMAGGALLYLACLWYARETLALSALRGALGRGRRAHAGGAR